MKLVAPFYEVRAWLQGLQAGGLKRVVELQPEVLARMEKNHCSENESEAKQLALRVEAKLIDPRKINVFEGGQGNG